MRMRENQVFFRWMAGRDIVDDATLADLIDDLEALMGAPFATWRVLGRPAQTLPWSAESRFELVDSRIGTGPNQELRFRLEAKENAAGIVSFEFQATMHPYTGRFVTTSDVRVKADRFVESTAVEAWRDRFQNWVQTADSIWAQAHDVDDDAMQNIFDANLLKFGYGVEVPAGADLSENPGREVSRGEFRYVVNWLTWFGPEMSKAMRVEERNLELVGLTVERLDSGVWLEIADTPLDLSDAMRERQRWVRNQLEIPALADRTRRTFGFWQKK